MTDNAEGIVKPCPWCGSTMPPSQRETDGAKWGALSCSECSATAPEVRTGYGPFPTWYDDALKAWNDRPAEAAVYARAMRDAQAVVDSMPSYDLDTGTGYGCHCAMKRAEGSWPGDWLDRDDTRDALTKLAALPATPGREGA